MIAEIDKLRAFLRRDFLIALSYRVGFAADLVNLLAQAVLFYYVSLIVDPARMPSFGGTRAGYVAFVAVGIAVSALLHTGVAGMAHAIRGEQVTGTLESLLVTPTSAWTLQLGWVIYDLSYVPVRTAVFLTIVAVGFGVDFRLDGILPALALLVVFLPCVWGLGAASAAAVLTFRQVSGVIGLATAALSIASGAYFPLDLLPGWLAGAARVNPVALALGGAREALLGGGGWSAVAPYALMLAPFSAVSLILGSLAFQLALQRERRLGTLGLY
ncbi:MAG: ABC transporter permease [Armatimonadota bacterium]|nr:ABC transporter permease [Armatimonadota bacterium]MDR7549360.1 ABC transporter permease [Armatimonadota bacterium]